ncbi:MAG: GntR family transcriptional regulator [Cereibacter sphaeroides]|uniref:GntR family transcriptional regulator n=1 Tax=Cereibacter sphaeroides TaxID=1063 RepID=A0A2W5SDP8_CERSP|nr:MAG: GntR family transcriptional regulator [Cereibacter sphaeroides]
MIAGWEAVRAEVMRRITAQEWRPGGMIPGEEALAAEFGCARATVNRALRDLADSGVLERRRKAGTRVALHPVRRATLEIPVIRQEVEGRGQRYAYSLLSDQVETAPLNVVSVLGMPPGAELRHLVSLHFADRKPFAMEDRWLNPVALGGADPDFATVSANEWLVANVPYASGDIAFSAEPANGQEAEMLDLAKGAALFIVERTTWTAEAAVTSVRLAYRPGYRLQTLV